MTTRTVALAFAMLLGAEQVSATAVVVLRPDATRVILASDSRLTTVGPDGRLRFRSGCKIFRAGPWWFTNGGFTRSADVDVNALVARAVASATSMDAAMRALQQVYRATLQPSILRAPYYQQKPPGTPVVAIVVAGLDHGVLSVGRFGADVVRQQPFALEDYGATCPGRLCPDGRLLYGVSQQGPVVDLLLKRPRPDWLERADAPAARRLIAMQIAATPERVGGPIDVLELTAAGARWAERDPQSACAAK
jgi:hypothetical protein